MALVHHNVDLSKKKQEYLRRVNDKREAVFMAGHVVPTAVSSSFSGKILQTREVDRANWLTSYSAYSEAVAAGHGTDMGANFRTADNTMVHVSFEEGLSVLRDLRSWGAEVYNHSWALKDAIVAADTVSALAAIDIESGWSS